MSVGTLIVSFIRVCLLAQFLVLMQPAHSEEGFVRTETGQKIVFAITDKIFPAEWVKAPMLAHAESLSAIETTRTIAAVRKALAKYSPTFLAANLRTIYIVCHLSEYQTAVGGFGWHEEKSIYVCNNGKDAGNSDLALEDTVHHEFAHILAANHPRSFSSKQWQHLNPAGFRYGNGGLEYIKHRAEGDPTFDEEMLAQGFVEKYAASAIQEDFACTAAALFSESPRLWLAAEQNEVLRKKVGMVVAFYNSLDKSMAENYFRHIPSVRDDGSGEAWMEWGGTLYAANINRGKPIIVTPGSTVIWPAGAQVVFNSPPKVVK